METLTGVEALRKRRANIAGWIAEHVQPAARAMAEAREDSEPAWELEIRDYQLDAWGALWDARQAGRRRALVHLATGLGKTHVAVCDVLKYRQEWAAAGNNTIPRVLFVSHKNEINEQAAEDFLGIIPDLQIDMFATQRQEPPQDVDVRFATFQGLLSEKHRFHPDDYEYIIYDEAHHTEAETFSQIRGYFNPLFELALTATPRRMDEQDITEYFGEAVYSKDFAEAMAEGLLADVDYHIMLDSAVRDAMQAGFEPKTLQELYELMRVAPRNEKIAGHIREEQLRQGEGAKTIVFCQDLEHVEAMANELGATAYHSGLSKTQRRQILRDFRAGRIRTICTRDLFNEGVNIPDASLLVFARTTGSETVYLQQLGRGLRGRNKKVTVLDFVANVERIVRLRELSDAVQRHAKTLGQPTTESDTEGKEPGLRIRSDHADFSFDRLAIDIAEKFIALQNRRLPEGWVSVATACVMLGRSHDTLHGWAEILDVELPVFERRTDGSELRGVSPHVMGLFKEYQRAAEETEEEVLSLNMWRRRLNISYDTILKAVKKAGWDPLPMRLTTNGAGSARALSTSQVQELKTRFPELFVEPLPDGWKSQNDVAELLGVGGKTVERARKRLGWKETSHKAPHGQTVQSYSPEQIEILRNLPEFNLKPADDTITSLVVVARQLKSSTDTMQEIFEKHGVTLGSFTFGASNTPGKGLTDEQIEFIRPLLLQPLPPGYKRPTEVAEGLGISARTLMTRIDKWGWEVPWYKAEVGKQGKPGRGFSPEQVELLHEMKREGKLK